MNKPSLPTKCRSLLTHRRLPVVVVLLAVLLTLPSITAGLCIDDHFHKLIIQGHGSRIGLHNAPSDLFVFFDGNPERIRQLIDVGVLPWSAYEDIKGAFWRPLTVLTHRLDYALWPSLPPMMHLHSILWYALLVVMVGFLYRRMMGPASAAAGLAMLLYAVDDAHAMPAMFLANRNSLPAAIFGILALLAHDRWRRKDWRLGALIGPVMLAVSLLFKEEGISTFAYLLAYALFIDEGRLRSRLSSLAPYIIVIVVWRIAWTHLGYGVSNIDSYIDPIHEPLHFCQKLVYWLPALLVAQFGGVSALVFLFLTPHGRFLLFSGEIAFLSLLALALWPMLRRDRTARFWAVGMMLSAIPVCATVPDDRMLIFPGIGAMGLVAMLLARTFSDRGPRTRYRPAIAALCGLLVVIHLAISPPSLALRCYSPTALRGFLDRICISKPFDRTIEKQDLVIVNPPVNFCTLYPMLQWGSRGEPMPRHLRALAPSLLQPTEVRRTDERTLVIRPAWGYLAGLDDKLVRNETNPLKLGEVIRLTGMSATVVSMTSDGRPAEVAFRFAVPLQDASLRWLQWKDDRYVPFHPPAVGRSVTLPGSPIGIRELLRP